MSKPIVPWPGGKRRLLPTLLPLLQEVPHKCYCEPFAGGAAVLFARDPAPIEVLNDIDGELVRLYRVVSCHLEEFMRQFKWSLVSREMYRWAQMQAPETLTDIQRAARFYYLQKLGFGGKVEGRSLGVGPTAAKRLNLLRLEEELSAAHLRLHRVTIEHLAWQACVARYDRPTTLFLLDPPYWETEGYGVDFGWEQYEALAAALRGLKGHAILTINDHPRIRQLFDWLPHQLVPIRYTLGGGDGPERREVIYRTWSR